jgi:hypothetical protein
MQAKAYPSQPQAVQSIGSKQNATLQPERPSVNTAVIDAHRIHTCKTWYHNHLTSDKAYTLLVHVEAALTQLLIHKQHRCTALLYTAIGRGLLCCSGLMLLRRLFPVGCWQMGRWQEGRGCPGRLEVVQGACRLARA